MRSILELLRSVLVASLAFVLMFVALAILPEGGPIGGLPQDLDDSRGGSGTGASIDIRPVERDRPRVSASGPASASRRIAAPEARGYAERRLTAPIPPERYQSAYRAPEDGTEWRETALGERWLGYRTILPRSAYSGAPRPVLLILPDPSASPVGLLEAWRRTAERAGLILAAPEPGWQAFGARSVAEAMLADLEGETTLDRGRLFLFGDGRGGAAALGLAGAPELGLRAVAVHGRASLADPTGAGAAVPLALYAGTGAGPRAISGVEATAAAFAGAGHPVTLVRVEGHTDWFEPIGAWLAGEIWGLFRRS